MVEVGRFVDGLKAAGVELFVGVRVKFPCGCYCADRGVAPRTVSKGPWRPGMNKGGMIG